MSWSEHRGTSGFDSIASSGIGIAFRRPSCYRCQRYGDEEPAESESRSSGALLVGAPRALPRGHSDWSGSLPFSRNRCPAGCPRAWRVPALALASPTDPLWIGGVYDAGDWDAAVLASAFSDGVAGATGPKDSGRRGSLSARFRWAGPARPHASPFRPSSAELLPPPESCMDSPRLGPRRPARRPLADVRIAVFANSDFEEASVMSPRPPIVPARRIHVAGFRAPIKAPRQWPCDRGGPVREGTPKKERDEGALTK
jgi:hypothetical protein